MIRCDWGTVWPDLAIYWTLGNFLKSLVTTNLSKSSTFLSNFCKGVKNHHFSSEIILGNFCRDLATFFCSHCNQECTFNGYIKFSFQDERVNHETFCSYRLVCCRFAQQGCQIESTFKEIQQHHKICTFNPAAVAAATTPTTPATAPASLTTTSEDWQRKQDVWRDQCCKTFLT